MSTSASLDGDGWVTAHGVEGFTAFDVQVLAAHAIDDEPRLIGLRLDPKDDATLRSCYLTSARLRTLPLTDLLTQALALTAFDFHEWARLAQKTRASGKARPRGGTREHAQEVAQVYEAARRTPGAAPRQAVADFFDVSKPTADRYIREARATGDLAPYKAGAE